MFWFVLALVFGISFIILFLFMLGLACLKKGRDIDVNCDSDFDDSK